ncbi:MAG: Ig-like domain-containing protein [candidate division KSB1 bacterium]|nr:Ig-like domain-containing protein [candidate division KSB1 bacterium]
MPIKVITIVIIIWVILTMGPLLKAQEQVAVPTVSDSTRQPTVTKIEDIKSFWELTRLGGSLRWPIFLVFIVGVVFIVRKLVELFWDIRKSKPLLKLDLSTMTIEEISKTLDEVPRSKVSQLFSTLLNIFHTTGQASQFSEEIVNYVKYEQDRFETFKGRLSFLSDTEGALGLLGTVWGMFLTFFGGNLDKQVILNGMGIALVTTIMGLVASIILNTFTTEVFSRFNKQLDLLQRKSDEFRIRMMEIEQSYQPKPISRRDGLHLVPSEEAVAIPPPRVKLGPPHKLVYISGDGQSGTVNTRLPNPFVVEVLDVYENKLPHQIIRFTVESEGGNLANGGRVQDVETDENGQAKTYLTIGTRVEENIVKAMARSLNGKYLEFRALAKPAPPAELILVSGNNQNAPAGSKLKEPFVVAVKDAYDNPIPNYPVTFKVSLGNGNFLGRNSKYSVVTDSNGLAQAYFTLGTKPGFNRIVVEAKKLRRSKVEFQALGQ